jgi:hypothetical protein
MTGFKKNKLKRCSNCNQLKPLTDFSKNKNRKDGHNGECKDCVNNKYRYNLRNKYKSSYTIRIPDFENAADHFKTMELIQCQRCGGWYPKLTKYLLVQRLSKTGFYKYCINCCNDIIYTKYKADKSIKKMYN